MSDIVNDYFKRFYPPQEKLAAARPKMGPMDIIYLRVEGYDTIFPRMACVDGFSMSVQGHGGAYSTPRDDFADHYSAVEVGFPSEREELLMPYIDGGEDTDPTETVYGYVPIEIIERVIAKHGGLAS